MDFYIIIIPPLAMSLFMVIHLLLLRRRDRSIWVKVSASAWPPARKTAPGSELGLYVKRRRQLEKLSLRAVAKQTQIGTSTLSRIENGTGIPDTPTLARLAIWLGIPFERIVGHSSYEHPIASYPQESLPDIASCHFRADDNLSPENARALEEVFRIAYRQLSKQDKVDE